MLRHDATWRATVEDAANPGNRIIIEFLNNSFHITWINPPGEDRSARIRLVEID